jgi:hypothetical protein
MTWQYLSVVSTTAQVFIYLVRTKEEQKYIAGI